MSYTNIDIQTIGFEAKQVLGRNTSLEIFGTSSRGVYLQTANDMTLFVSSEEFHGPLTLNVVGDLEGFLEISPRTIADITGNSILFPGPKLALSFNDSEIWTPAPPPKFKGLRQNILADLFQQSVLLAGDNPFFPLLEMALTSKSLPLPGFPDFFRRMIFLNKSIQTGEASNLTWELENLLGAGPGLTPLGDDLILGILLALNRGIKSPIPESYLEKLNQGVIDLALDKTTRLSFSLLVCAADGSADQRLIQVLDSLLSGAPIKDKELTQLLRWGSTSGFAVLAGMILALSAR